MRILHTADWHLGKKLEKFSRLQEQQEVLEEIIALADTHKIDVVLLAGDIFDAFNPPTEAVDLFYRSIKRLSNNGRRAVIALAGNHDSPDRIQSPDPLARECGILFAGYPGSHIAAGTLNEHIEIVKSEPGFIEIRLQTYSYPLRLLLTPYANEFRLKTFLGAEGSEQELREMLAGRWSELAQRHCDAAGINLLMAHLFVMQQGTEPPQEPEDEKPILHVGGAQAIFSENIPQEIQYAALGHLHRAHRVDATRAPIYYSGSPLAYSFSEAGQQKKVFLIDLQPGQTAQPQALALASGRPLHRKTFDCQEAALRWLQENPDALVELTLVSDEYMTAEQRRHLYQTHPGIVTLIPAVRNAHILEEREQSLDLTLPVEELFKAYFQSKYRQEPNAEMMSLFKEIRAEQPEE